MLIITCDALRDLVPFVKFKKREKHPGRNDTLEKLQAEAYNFIRSITSPWEFFTFFKLYKWYQITHSITYVANFKLKRTGDFANTKINNERKFSIKKTMEQLS